MDARETGNEATWHLRGLSGLQETSYENVLCPMINPKSTKSVHGKNPTKYVY